MGAVFSCNGCHHYNQCFNAASSMMATTSAAAPAPPYRFTAEVFKLSPDHAEWVKVHPTQLTIAVNQRPGMQQHGVLELDASDLARQSVMRIPISKDCDLRRYSDRFVYWTTKDSQVYALNAVSLSDVDHFCALTSASLPADCAAYRFHARIAHLLNLRHGVVVENEEPLSFSIKCIIVFEPPETLKFLDEAESCLFTTSALECLMSASEVDKTVYISFPSRAIAIEFGQLKVLRTFCQMVLNESSAQLRGTPGEDTTISLQKQLQTVVELMREGMRPSYAQVRSRHVTPRCTSGTVKNRIESLYTLKYLLLYRIASLKDMLPQTHIGFAEMIYPAEMLVKASTKHAPQIIHLSCILGSQFSIRQELEEIRRRPSNSVVLPSTSVDLTPLPTMSHPPETARLPTEPSTSLKSSRPSECNNAAVQQERLVKSIVELIRTEESFIADLERLIQKYLVPTNMIVLDTARRIQRIHNEFITALQEASGDICTCAEKNPEALTYLQIKDAVMRICAVFVNNCDRFKVYSEYAAFYLRFQHRRHEDIQLQHKLAELNPSGDQSQSIDSLLIKPIQRVLRYPLFLAQIKDNCAADSKEYKHSAQALSRVQTLATYVNEMQRIYEEYGAEIDRISRCTEVKQMGLQITLHELFMFAQLKCHPPKEKTFFDCVAFIFTGCILLLPHMKKKEMVSFCHVLPIWEVQITASTATANQSAAHQFTLIRSSTGYRSMYEMSCCHADIKTQFVKSARKALNAYQKRQASRPVSGSSSDWGYASGH